MDNKICGYIEKYTNQFDEIMKTDYDLQVPTYLGGFFNGSVAWYPFDKSWRLLQIGSLFGAIDESLSSKVGSIDILEPDKRRAAATEQRLGSFTNVQVHNAAYSDFLRSGSPKYDCIIWIADEYHDRFESLAEYRALLEQLKQALAPSGRILFSLPNHGGSKYLCGEPRSEQIYMPTYEEFRQLIAGLFENTKHYYPLPDVRCTQLLYTDSRTPAEEINERLMVFRLSQRSSSESNLLSTLNGNPEKLNFCNSFFAELTNSTPADVRFSTITVDRSKAQSFATVIFGNGTVRKAAVYKEGAEQLQKMLRHSRQLAERGVSTVEMTYLENCNALSMNYIQKETLSDYIRSIANDEAAMMATVDRIYQAILRSSEQSLDSDGNVILKQASIEMIPVNCFLVNGELKFFDQEFVMENCPADYVLFRTVNDIALFVCKGDSALVRKLKDKYGLTEKWEAFQKIETDFQTKLHCREIYKGMRDWFRDNKIR